jgi:hypothetical protein
MGVRRKFFKMILYAPSATLDLPGSTLEDFLHSMRNLPPGVDFNPYWIVLIDYYFGRQETRDLLEIITTKEAFEARMYELCARDRLEPGEEENETDKFVRDFNEPKTLIILDDINVQAGSWLAKVIVDMRKLFRENARVVSPDAFS